MEVEPPPSAARVFIDEVRQAQAVSGRKLSGRTSLPDAQRFAIRATVTSGVVTQPDAAITPQVKEKLLERFEEMARRVREPVPARLRSDILALLVAELWANARSLDAPPERLISATVVSGAVGPELRREFPEFADSPGVYRQAMTQGRSDPKGTLGRLRAAVAALAADDEFAQFRETPWVFREAAIGNPADPKKGLRRIVRSAAALEAADEFAEFRDTPGIFTRVAAHNPTDPAFALRNVQRASAALADDDEFAEFRDTPGIFRKVAMGNPGDPKGALRQIRKTVAELAADEEFARLRDKPWVFRRAAANAPASARGALRRILASGAAEDNGAGASHADQVDARRMPPAQGTREK